MSLFEKYAVEPGSRRARRYQGVFVAQKINRSGEPDPEPLGPDWCPDCRCRIDDEGLCSNRRCAKSNEEGWLGTGWATHPNR